MTSLHYDDDPSFDPYYDRKLHVSLLGLDDPEERAMATIIAEETERQRELFRQNFKVTYVVPKSELPEGFVMPRPADTVGWDVLLTFGDCLFRCVERAHSTPEDILDFARGRCLPPEPWTLMWCSVAYKLAKVAGGEGEATIKAAAEHAMNEKVREVAQRAGVKSGEVRRQQSLIPEDAELLKDRDYFMQTMERRHVARKLAQKYGMSVEMVRIRLREAEERERTGSGRE